MSSRHNVNVKKGQQGFQPTQPKPVSAPTASPAVSSRVENVNTPSGPPPVEEAYGAFKHRPVTVGAPDWTRASDTDYEIVLNNPHPGLDGFITVAISDAGGQYEACVIEFDDEEGLDVTIVDTALFNTEEEAKAWAETWDPAVTA